MTGEAKKQVIPEVAGTIRIKPTGHASISLEGSVDRASVRAVLEHRFWLKDPANVLGSFCDIPNADRAPDPWIDLSFTTGGRGGQMLLHHIGIVVVEITPATNLYALRYGYRIESPIIHDPRQTAFVQFLRLPGESSFLEFVAPDGPESKLNAAAAKRQGLNHLCFTVDDIEQEVERLVGTDMALLCEPVPAAAFPGRRIAWLLGFDRIPIELVERGPKNEF